MPIGYILVTQIGYLLGAIEWEHVGHMTGQIVATVVAQILNKFGAHILATDRKSVV